MGGISGETPPLQPRPRMERLAARAERSEIGEVEAPFGLLVHENSSCRRISTERKYQESSWLAWGL